MPSPSCLAPNRPQGGHSALFQIAAFLYFFLPPLFFYFGASSFALGVAIASAFPIYAQLSSDVRSHQVIPRVRSLLPWGGLVFGFLLAHLALASLGQPFYWMRSLASMGLLMSILLSAGILSSWLSRVPDLIIYRSICAVAVTLVLLVPWSLAGSQPASIKQFIRPVFPFTEPSHWALSTIPVLLFLCVVSRGWHRTAFLMMAMVLPILVQNLTLLAGVLIILALSMPLRYAVPMIFIEIYATVFSNTRQKTFHLDRLGGVVSEATANLSALVYRQGWETMGHTLISTKGWGVGFQQLGLQPISTESTMAIQKIIPGGLNLMDGGFVLAKLVSEFGFFGIFLTLVKPLQNP